MFTTLSRLSQDVLRNIIGLRYRQAFKNLPVGARPARCSRTPELTSHSGVKAVLRRQYRPISLSRPPLPAQAVGLERSHQNRSPARGEHRKGGGVSSLWLQARGLRAANGEE
jgi:hypothetical protein